MRVCCAARPVDVQVSFLLFFFVHSAVVLCCADWVQVRCGMAVPTLSLAVYFDVKERRPSARGLYTGCKTPAGGGSVTGGKNTHPPTQGRGGRTALLLSHVGRVMRSREDARFCRELIGREQAFWRDVAQTVLAA